MYSDMMETLREEFGDNPEEVRFCLYHHPATSMTLSMSITYIPLSINIY